METETKSLKSVAIDAAAVRAQFPILRDPALVYLDSAASSQKPRVVIDAIRDYYEHDNANVHRGVYALAERATEAYDGARRKVARFFNAPHERQIVFTRNTTEAINLVANAWGRWALRPGDIILTSEMEHHSNIVPWQLLTERTGATLRWFGLTDDGRLDLSNIDEVITERTKVVSLTWVSNMLGTINPVREIADRAHAVGAVVVGVVTEQQHEVGMSRSRERVVRVAHCALVRVAGAGVPEEPDASRRGDTGRR